MREWFLRLWDSVLKGYAERLGVEEWAKGVQHLVDSLLILSLALLCIGIARALIFWLAHVRVKRASYRRRMETIASLIYSVAKYAIYISATLWILTVWGVNTQGLIVGSAVLGAAVGFGSQGLVQDIIVGLSILAEEQLSVGDLVEISGKLGAVEEVGLRVIKLRDSLGVQHVIFNRTIGMVSN
jgi:moderate conductance mechanosensitive channel